MRRKLPWGQVAGKGARAAGAGVVLVTICGGLVLFLFLRLRPETPRSEAAPGEPPVQRLGSGIEVARVPVGVTADLEGRPLGKLRFLIVRGKTRPSLDRAHDLLRRARAAPERFAELVRQRSEDPSTRKDGGLVEVDFASKAGAAGLSGETLEAVAQLDPGAIGGPYPGARGMYLVKVEERRARPAEVTAP